MKYKPISSKILAFSTLVAVRTTLAALSLISFVLLHPSMVHAQDSLSDSSGINAYGLSDFSGISLDSQIASIKSIGGKVVVILPPYQPCSPEEPCVLPEVQPITHPGDPGAIIVLLNNQYYLLSRNQYYLLSGDQYSQLLNNQNLLLKD